MKLLLPFIFAVLINSLYCQSTAGIYHFKFFIDKQLTNSVLVSTGSGTNNFSGGAFRMPSNYVDSIKQIIENGVGKELFSLTECTYATKKNGTLRKTYNTGQHVGGLPKTYIKKRAILSFEKDYYVRIKLRFNVFRGVQIGVPNLNYSRVRPYVLLKIKAFDVNRDRIYSKRIRVYDFERLQSVQYSLGNVSVRNSEIITPAQICDMIRKTFIKLGEKNTPK